MPAREPGKVAGAGLTPDPKEDRKFREAIEAAMRKRNPWWRRYSLIFG